jgi:hypothetical protein
MVKKNIILNVKNCDFLLIPDFPDNNDYRYMESFNIQKADNHLWFCDHAQSLTRYLGNAG